MPSRSRALPLALAGFALGVSALLMFSWWSGASGGGGSRDAMEPGGGDPSLAAGSGSVAPVLGAQDCLPILRGAKSALEGAKGRKLQLEERERLEAEIGRVVSYLDLRLRLEGSLADYEWVELCQLEVPTSLGPKPSVRKFSMEELPRRAAALALSASGRDIALSAIKATNEKDRVALNFAAPKGKPLLLRHNLPKRETIRLRQRAKIAKLEIAWAATGSGTARARGTVYIGITKDPEYLPWAHATLERATQSLNKGKLDDAAKRIAKAIEQIEGGLKSPGSDT